LKFKITGVHITKYGLRLLQKDKESIQNIITQNLQDEKGKTLDFLHNLTFCTKSSIRVDQGTYQIKA